MSAAFLDNLKEKLSAKNDAALCRALQLTPPQVSKVRNGRLPVTAGLLCKASEATDLTIKQLKALM
jgi:antitoxin HigA-1